MRVISLNCNGIRSAARKGFFDWLPQQRARVVCLQETKAQPADLADGEHFTPSGWWVYQNPAVKKGYSGTAIYSRLEPDAVIDRLGNEEFDNEGRFLEARFGTLSVISLYLPSGSAGPERQASKDRFLDFFMPLLTEWRSNGREYIICGDWNIAHTKLDLKNWRGNQKNSGFLPHERAWMDQLLGNEAHYTPQLKAKATLGGATAEMPGRIMSVGASTIRSSPQNSAQRSNLRAFTRTHASRITRP